MSSTLNNKLDKAMTTEQFTQVVDAILEGKYSWACVLILRFAGYNPLHYIPYRTYNRLMKEHSEVSKRNHGEPSQLFPNPPLPERNLPQPKTHQIRDLSYLEPLNSSSDVLTHSLKGGYALSYARLEHSEYLKYLIS
jgi:hypothetical protein